MSIFDISLLVILGGFTVNGLFKGLLRILGSLIGLIVGAYAASHYYLLFFDWWKDWGWFQAWAADHAGAGKVISFIILFVLIARLVDFLFLVVEKVFNFMAVIPGSRFINNILGAIFGFLEGALFLGLIIYVISRYSFVGNYFGSQLAESSVAPFLLKIVNIILPLLPEALKALRAII
ncbi:MAG: CvpA family protein [Patescibacteria group bacterium]